MTDAEMRQSQAEVLMSHMDRKHTGAISFEDFATVARGTTTTAYSPLSTHAAQRWVSARPRSAWCARHPRDAQRATGQVPLPSASNATRRWKIGRSGAGVCCGVLDTRLQRAGGLGAGVARRAGVPGNRHGRVWHARDRRSDADDGAAGRRQRRRASTRAESAAKNPLANLTSAVRQLDDDNSGCISLEEFTAAVSGVCCCVWATCLTGARACSTPFCSRNLSADRP